MKVFISSIMNGYTEFRAAVARAVETLGHTVVRAEEFHASSSSPQEACLAGVRAADLVILLLGERYGTPIPPDGLSATHLEYREARNRVPVLAFVQSGVVRDAAQEAFLEEVQDWETGTFRVSYDSVETLGSAVIRAVHEHELARSVGHVDESEMTERALALTRPSSARASSPQLVVGIAAAPHQQVLRPAELENPELTRGLQEMAMFGPHSVLRSEEGTTVSLRQGNLVLEQVSVSLGIDQVGSVRVAQSVSTFGKRSNQLLPVLIVEEVKEALSTVIQLAGTILDKVDASGRLTDVVIATSLNAAPYYGWRTIAENAANPNSVPLGPGRETVSVTLSPPRRQRRALAHDHMRIAEDLTILLKREHFEPQQRQQRW